MSRVIPSPILTRLSREAAIPPTEWVARFVDDIPTGLAVFDGDLRYIAANAPWIDAFGLAAASVAGQHHEALDAVAGPELAQWQRRAAAGEIVDCCEIKFGGADGRQPPLTVSFRPRRGDDGVIVGVLAALHGFAVVPPGAAALDMPDPLTGVAGREAFLARVRAALDPTDSQNVSTAIFLLDIEDFKGINDLYGARIGDQVLASIAARLLTGVRSRSTRTKSEDGSTAPARSDLVARLGADEFGVVLGGAAPVATDADAFARRLLQLVAAPVIIGERRIRLTANVGYLVTGPGHQSEDDVLRDLNVAVAEAKSRGPNGVKASDPALTSMMGRRLSLLDELRRAHDEGEFVMHYQPILDLSDGRIVGAEALLRWNNPREGLMPPGAFLPLLEESGLIVPVGSWLIRDVVRQMQAWRAQYGRDILEWISINVSARQFNDPSLLLATLSEINASGFPLDRLKLEITESAVMRNPEVTRAVLGEMKAIGIRVALDDFGTGYSALGALRHYSVDMIKIDRDFTARLDTDDGRELVMALLKIARIYGAAVVAEGVETSAQHDLLRDAGCGFGQGYLFAKPMDGAIFGASTMAKFAQNIAAASPAS